MMHVKVLGSGCADFMNTLKLIHEVAAEKGIELQLEQVEELQEIAGYGATSTPGVVIEGKLLHAGGVPDRSKVAGWLAGGVALPVAPPLGSCCSGGGCA